MSQLSENVRQVLIQLLPAFIINDIKCYAFYDNHPRDEKNIDITVYTKTGEVREYFQRDLVSCVNVGNMGIHPEIRILRNSRCELFYLVAGGGELTILSRKDKLEIHQRLTEVSHYKVIDSACSGEAILNVVPQYSEVPIVPDDNFENFKPVDFKPSSGLVLHESLIIHLMKKLVESKFNSKCSEKSLKEFANIRQLVAIAMYKKIHPNLDDSVFKDGFNEMGNALKVFTEKPWIKTCNKKIVIVLSVCNGNNEPLEEVQVLIHGTTGQSIEYTTKTYQKTSDHPFWNETQAQMIVPKVESAIVTVIDLEELKDSIVSRIKFDGVIIYKKAGKEGLLPMDSVMLSSLDTMGEEFDAFCNDLEDENTMLAVLATTEKTELILRHIKRPEEPTITIDIFCEYLKMERIPHTDNIVIHRKSPYHVLNGVMVLLDPARSAKPGQLAVSVHSRSPSQILAMIHLIQDAVPFEIVITSPSYKITSRTEIFASYNESTESDSEQIPDYMNYATSMLNRTALVLQYLDNSMIHMNESRSAEVRNKIGSEIDLFAQGEAGYVVFKKKMRDEAAYGLEMLEDNLVWVPFTDEMCVD